MSIEVIKAQIDKFLESDAPEVIAIKGAWGVGKTYSWKKYLNEAKLRDRIKLNRYSYVSMFGVNSLESFKYAIFENVVSKNLIGTEPSVDTFKKNTSDLLESMSRKSFDFFRSSPLLKSFTPAIDSLSFLSLNGTLICIDDLERKGGNLTIKDVLGLISMLKEQKKCKIALLLNDNEEGMDDYEKYREKVIDIELEFAPTATECASIAYEGKGYIYETLAELTKKLDIRNIRVLKKIERLINLAMPYLDGYEQDIKYQLINSLTLFSWCYYGSSNGAPTLDFVTNIGYSLFGIGDDKKKDTEEHIRWKAILREYGYSNTDDLDLVLANAVRTGYFVEDTLKQEATKNNGLVIASKTQQSFSDTWHLYHDTFENNQNEVINALYDSFKLNARYITPVNLNGTVTLFRELGETKKCSELIDFYISLRKEEKELFDLSNFFGDCPDEEVVYKFREIHLTNVTTESVKQILERISGRNGWHERDELILANTTVDEY